MPLRMPLMKKRTALLRKLKTLFRRYRSQPIGLLIEKITHPTRLGELLRRRTLEPVLLVYSRLGSKEDSKTPGARPKAPRIWLEGMSRPLLNLVG